MGRETDSLIQNWLIPTVYHLRCNCAEQFEFIMYTSVMPRLFYEPPIFGAGVRHPAMHAVWNTSGVLQL